MEDSSPTLLMMAGLPGAGKTTLAGELMRELGWRVIDKDGYRVGLLERGIDEDAAANKAYERSFKELRVALVEEGLSVIFDTAALHLFILDSVKEILNSAPGARLKVILCVVDRDLRNERLRTRKGQHTRITVEPDTITDYLRYFDHLPEEKLIIYTDVSIEECLSKAKKYVKS